MTRQRMGHVAWSYPHAIQDGRKGLCNIYMYLSSHLIFIRGFFLYEHTQKFLDQ